MNLSIPLSKKVNRFTNSLLDNEVHRIGTRYLGSVFFMERSTLDGVVDTFCEGVKQLDKSKSLQVSSDGPKLDLVFLKKLSCLKEEEELKPINDIGTRALHEIHGSMQAGLKSSDWELQKLLKVMLQFLHGAPVLTVLHENVTKSLEYSKKFLGHRWCENEMFAEKAGIISYQNLPKICDVQFWSKQK